MHAPAEDAARTASGRPTAIVLAGGGARGAYEVGVVRYLYEVLSGELGRTDLFDLYTGTSAGALNCCALASSNRDPCDGVRQLAEYWSSITMERVLRFGNRELTKVPSVLLGKRGGLQSLRYHRRSPDRHGPPHPPVDGIFDTTPLYEDMKSVIPWDDLQANIASGRVRGAAVCATEVCTSRSVVFYQMHENEAYAPGHDPAKHEVAVRLDVQHAMASAAIPFLFPAVQVNGVCHVDGALRQNAPLNPSIRMGADRILVVGLARAPRIKYNTARIGCRRTPFPGSLFLLGRTVNAVMDGILDYEIHRIEMFNELIRAGCASYGEDFLARLNEATRPYRNADYRPIRVEHVRPTRNLNVVALEALKEAPGEFRMPGAPGRILETILKSYHLLESELSSFLMFTPTYVHKLVQLGYEDAKAKRDDLLAFFQGEG